MEPTNNTLTANVWKFNFFYWMNKIISSQEFRNDLDTLDADTAYIEDAKAPDERPVTSPTSRTISRRVS
jgi:hypothetical protein